MKFNLYIVRHGQTYLNKYEKMQGWSDSPLTSKGIEDLKKLQEKLKDIRFDKILTSDLGRTTESVNILREKNENFKDVEHKSMKEFRETFFGGFEGGDNKEVWDTIIKSKGFETMEEMMNTLHLSDTLDAFNEIDPHKDAETKEKFYERLEQSVEVLKDNADEKSNILLVSHGNYIRHFIYNYYGSLITDISNSACFKCICDTESEKFITEIVPI